MFDNRKKPSSKKSVKSSASASTVVELPAPVLIDRVAVAVATLRNNSTVLVSETKSGSTKSISYNADVLAAMRGMFPSNKTYRFLIHANVTIGSTGAGVVQVAFTSNPSVLTYSEWSALSALFDECRLRSSQVGVTSAAIVANKAVPLFLAYDHVTSTGTGVGFGNVQRLAGSVVFNSLFMNGGSGRHTQSTKIASSRAYSPTATPTSTVVDSGMNGQWDLSGQDTTANSVTVGYADVSNVVEFRNRA